MFHLLSRSARVHNSEYFCTSVFIMIDITLIFQIPWITWLGKISAQTLDATEKNVHSAILSVFELSPSCQSTVMLTIDSCANVSAPRMAVRVYKTHFSLCENDRMQWVKTTKLSQTAVCTDNYQIYLLTTIRQNHYMKSIVWRQGHPLLLDRMDNYDNTLHTYTDRMLSITSRLKASRLMAEKFFEALVHYLSPSSERRELPVKPVWSTRSWTGSQKNNVQLKWIQWEKKASIMKIYCVKHIMIKRLTPLQTQTHLSVIWALWGQLYMHLKKHRVKATTPEWLLYFWSQMQCPAVNLMISPSKTPSERWEL